MFNRTQKEALVEGIRKDIEGARGIFLTNVIGVSSNDAVALRKNIRDKRGTIKVTRNTLFQRAAQGTVAEGLLKDLKGPHAVAFAFEDAAGVAKCLKDAAKDHEVIEFKGGILNGEALTQAQVVELASLPSREEMLGTVLATMMAPVSAFARVLYAINEQKESGAPAEPAAEEAPAAEAAPEATEGDA